MLTKKQDLVTKNKVTLKSSLFNLYGFRLSSILAPNITKLYSETIFYSKAISATNFKLLSFKSKAAKHQIGVFSVDNKQTKSATHSNINSSILSFSNKEPNTNNYCLGGFISYINHFSESNQLTNLYKNVYRKIYRSTDFIIGSKVVSENPLIKDYYNNSIFKI